MAAKGTAAKAEITKIIQDAFGNKFLGEVDKKLYVQVLENGEPIQIAIALTCPNKQITISNGPVIKGDRMNFDSEPSVSVISTESAEITEDERETIAEMMKRLGL